MELESSGLLPPGFHDPSLGDFYQTFVESIPESQTRGKIYLNLLKFFECISEKYEPDEVWVDGSFVTSKINPNDVDIIVFLKVDELILMHDSGDIAAKYDDIDSYYSFSMSDYNKMRMSPSDYYEHVVNKRNYWRGQYGFDRSDRPKGIVRLKWEIISARLKGGV